MEPCRVNLKKKNKKQEDPYITFLKECEKNRKVEFEQGKEFLNTFLSTQENVLMNCTQVFLAGLKQIMYDKNKQRDNLNISDSD